MKHTLFASLVLCSLAITRLEAAEPEAGFTSLFDGKTFTGWKAAIENTNTWRIEDGTLVARGDRCHLFYVGDETPFKNFELKVDVMTETNSNGGIYFHTKYQERGFPSKGFECQVNVSHSDWIKTGSLYGVVSVASTPAKDNEWWTQHITVKGNKVTVRINGQIVLEYTEPPGVQGGPNLSHKLDSGTFALQAHDPKSVVHIKNIRVKRLD